MDLQIQQQLATNMNDCEFTKLIQKEHWIDNCPLMMTITARKHQPVIIGKRLLPKYLTKMTKNGVVKNCPTTSNAITTGSDYDRG